MAKRAKRKSKMEMTPPSFERGVANVIQLRLSRSRPEPLPQQAPAPVAPAAAPKAAKPAAERAVSLPRRLRRWRTGRSSTVPAPEPARTPQPSAREVERPRWAAKPAFADDTADREEEFFSDRAAVVDEDSFHDLYAAHDPYTGEHDPVHHQSARRGKLITIAILAVGVLSIGGFLLYNKVLMPTPEEFAKVPVALPTPDMLKDAPLPGVPPAPGERSAPAVEKKAELAAPVQVEPTPAPAAVVEPIAAPAAEPAPVVEPAAGRGAMPRESEAELSAEERASYEALVAEARKLGFRKSAETAFEQALTLQPGGAAALSGLAMVYLNQGKNVQARDRAQEALSADARSSEAWIVLGAAYDALGEPAKAREAYQKCAALNDGKYSSECKRVLR